MVVNVLNPKTAIFFLAFLPQFVDPSMAVAPQVLVLGFEFIAIAVISDGAYALIAGTFGERVRRSAVANRWVDRGGGRKPDRPGRPGGDLKEISAPRPRAS